VGAGFHRSSQLPNLPARELLLTTIFPFPSSPHCAPKTMVAIDESVVKDEDEGCVN
jgi:hypothetical protein